MLVHNRIFVAIFKIRFIIYFDNPYSAIMRIINVEGTIPKLTIFVIGLTLTTAITNVGFQSVGAECSTEPHDQPACQYTPGRNAQAVCSEGECTASDFTPSENARGFCGGEIRCDEGEGIGPETFAPGQNPNRDIPPNED
jgi:hypothetical protein